MDNLEKLRDKEVEEISRETQLAVIKIEQILNHEYDKFDRLHAKGFIRILEQYYDLDLSDWLEAYDDYHLPPEPEVEHQDKQAKEPLPSAKSVSAKANTEEIQSKSPKTNAKEAEIKTDAKALQSKSPKAKEPSPATPTIKAKEPTSPEPAPTKTEPTEPAPLKTESTKSEPKPAKPKSSDPKPAKPKPTEPKSPKTEPKPKPATNPNITVLNNSQKATSSSTSRIVIAIVALIIIAILGYLAYSHLSKAKSTPKSSETTSSASIGSIKELDSYTKEESKEPIHPLTNPYLARDIANPNTTKIPEKLLKPSRIEVGNKAVLNEVAKDDEGSEEVSDVSAIPTASDTKEEASKEEAPTPVANTSPSEDKVAKKESKEALIDEAISKASEEASLPKMKGVLTTSVPNPAIIITPKEKIWIGVKDLATKAKEQEITTSTYSFTPTHDTLIATGHGDFVVQLGDDKSVYASKYPVRFIYNKEKGTLTRITYRRYLKLSGEAPAPKPATDEVEDAL